MPPSKEHLKKSVYIMLNDVIEQSFKKMIHLPNEGERLNKLINEATKEISYFTKEIDNNIYPKDSDKGKVFYDTISSELKQKSLTLLSQVQRLGTASETKIS